MGLDSIAHANTQANKRYFAIKCMSRQEIFDKKAMQHVKRELKILRSLPAVRSPCCPPRPSGVVRDNTTHCSVPRPTQKQVRDPDVRPLARLS